MPLPTPSARGSRHQTKQAFVYRALHQALLSCAIQPGERLVIDDLAKRLGVSIIPVREALQMLQAEGLVVNVPHVGAAAAALSRDSIVDVFTVLEGLEVVATRFLAERGSPEAVHALEPIVRDMDAAAEDGRHEDWADLNTRFHLTISAETGLPLLREMTERLLGRWDRIRRYYFNGVLSHRIRAAQLEHRDILSALEERDPARAQSEVQQHNRRALEAYLKYLDANEDKRPTTPVSPRGAGS
jgi:DNA-binding GntR family transcriptional regulator